MRVLPLWGLNRWAKRVDCEYIATHAENTSKHTTFMALIGSSEGCGAKNKILVVKCEQVVKLQ